MITKKFRNTAVAKPTKATSIDIAYRAGVSQSTVSRALRDSPLVSKETRDHIKAIAKELNYKIDKNARNLRTQSTDTLALVIFEDGGTSDHINPFFLAMISSIIRATAKRNYDLLVSFHQLHQDFRGDYEDSKRADGIIFLGYGDFLSYERMAKDLISTGTHFLTWGASMPGQQGITISCDNLVGGQLATEHLIKHGRKNIAFLGDISEHAPEFRERYRGYCRALSQAGIIINPKLQLKVSESSAQLGYETTKKLLRSRINFDAIFASSDLIAIGAMQALKDAGLRVPEDVSLMGFDDIQAGLHTTPGLSTIKQNAELAGEIITEMLIRMITRKEDEPPVVSRIIEPELVVRQSCGGYLRKARR